jgi:hypothetical protein
MQLFLANIYIYIFIFLNVVCSHITPSARSPAQARRFGGFGRERVRSMIITLRTYLHEHVPLNPYNLYRNVMQKMVWYATPASSARKHHKTTGKHFLARVL